MIKVKIIRHSERLDFSHPFYWLICFGQYWADSPLTKNGRIVAHKKGKQLISHNFNPKYIYTSPYKRTMATSTEIKSSFPHSIIVIEPLLSEYQPNYGHTIELYPEGIPTTYGGEDTGFNFPETYEKFTERIKFIISKLIEKNKNDILIMTHGEVLKIFINYLQTKYPEILLDAGCTPYLTTISFDYDKINDSIIESSVEID